jgi:nitrate reductase NapD
MAGVLVHALPHRARAVGTRIAKLSGATVHAASPDGKLVVTLESEDCAQILDHLTSIQRMRGVMSAVLVSEQNEPLSALDEEIPHEP